MSQTDALWEQSDFTSIFCVHLHSFTNSASFPWLSSANCTCVGKTTAKRWNPTVTETKKGGAHINNNIINRGFMERFQRLTALYNLIKEEHATRKYPHTNQ